MRTVAIGGGLARERLPAQQPMRTYAVGGSDRVVESDSTKTPSRGVIDFGSVVRTVDRFADETMPDVIKRAGWEQTGRGPMFRVPTAFKEWCARKSAEYRHRLRRGLYVAFCWIDQRLK